MSLLKEKKFLRTVFFQLLVLSFFLHILSFFQIIPFFHYELLVLIVAILGVFVLTEKNKFTIPNWLIIIPFFVIVFIHSIPIIRYTIPLGFDAGIYKYLFEHSGVLRGYAEPKGLYVLVDILRLFLRTDYLLTWALVILSALIGIFVFLIGKKYFGKEAGFFSLVVYSVSSIQLKAFHFLYYKQILALLLLLIILYYLEYPLIVILTGAFLSGVHTPTFLIFMLSYLLFSIRHLRTHFPCFVGIALLASPFYISNVSLLRPLQQIESIGGGNFLTLTSYFFLSTSLFFAFLGIFQVIKKRKFNLLFSLTIVTFIIIIFHLFFFYRYLINLDLFLAVFGGFGIVSLLMDTKRIGMVIFLIFLGFSFFSVLQISLQAMPEITEKELHDILELPNGTVLTERKYAPWILGYRGKVIAPLLFGDTHTKKEWDDFFYGNNETLLFFYRPDVVYVNQYLPYPCLRKENHYYISSCLNSSREVVA